jgi:hypothetical protein
MQNKLPLEYGPREAEILRELTKNKKIASKNEGFRRGIVAVDYLMDVNRGLLLEVLADMLNYTKEGLRDPSSFPKKLEASKSLASEIVATFAVQKGVQSADSIDIFRADLDNYLVLSKTKGLKGVDRDKIAERLSFLSEMAHQFAKREFESQSKEEDKSIALPHERLFANP